MISRTDHFRFDATTHRQFDRMRYAIRKFVGIVCTYRPIVMILDDHSGLVTGFP
jgi:hypothetical protein